MGRGEGRGWVLEASDDEPRHRGEGLLEAEVEAGLLARGAEEEVALLPLVNHLVLERVPSEEADPVEVPMLVQWPDGHIKAEVLNLPCETIDSLHHTDPLEISKHGGGVAASVTREATGGGIANEGGHVDHKVEP